MGSLQMRAGLPMRAARAETGAADSGRLPQGSTTWAVRKVSHPWYANGARMTAEMADTTRERLARDRMWDRPLPAQYFL